jgi:hypothetical protein
VIERANLFERVHDLGHLKRVTSKWLVVLPIPTPDPPEVSVAI